jgi:hypothetical protein
MPNKSVNDTNQNGTSEHEMSLSIEEARQEDCSSLLKDDENRQLPTKAQSGKSFNIDTSFLLTEKDNTTSNGVSCSNTSHHMPTHEPLLPSPTGTLRTVDTLDEAFEEISDLPNKHNAATVPMGTATDPDAKMSPIRLKAMKAAERYQHWQCHTHAVGLGPVSWLDEDEEEILNVYIRGDATEELNNCDSSSFTRILDGRAFISNYACATTSKSRSTLFCRRFGRVGNMVILKERNAWIPLSMHDGQEDTLDTIEDATATDISTGVPQRQFDIVLGPYWPKLLCFTLPLIIGFSTLTALKAVFRPDNDDSCLVISIWISSTLAWVFSLLCTSLVDPGILPRHKDRPAKNWRWNDSAQSYIPPDAVFEPDCNVVIEKYDHTCIYTGTAIGKNNMNSFMIFIFFTVFCLVEDIVLLVARM